eukprot:369555-Hanusia_phi.AAC.1
MGMTAESVLRLEQKLVSKQGNQDNQWNKFRMGLGRWEERRKGRIRGKKLRRRRRRGGRG